jgi:hypothetical protein
MTTTELLATVRRVEVRTNRLVNDTMVGAYLSHFKGRGMDFAKLHAYRAERPNSGHFNSLEFDGIRNQLNGHHG